MRHKRQEIPLYHKNRLRMGTWLVILYLIRRYMHSAVDIASYNNKIKRLKTGKKYKICGVGTGETQEEEWQSNTN